MKFGFALPQTGALASPQAIVEAAQEAERSGYATVWVLERLLRPVAPHTADGGPARPMPDTYAVAYDPIETLTFVAAKTAHIRLGTSIMVAPLHVPVMLAKRLATLDQLSGGRLVAGLGQGYSEEEFAAANVPLKRRGAGFEEFVGAMRAAWGPDPVSFEGRFYRIPPSQINPKPAQSGGPPLIIAAREPAAVERAARLGAGLHAIPTEWASFQDAVTRFRRPRGAADRDPGALPFVVRTNTTVTEGTAPDPRPPLSGSYDQVGDDLRRLRDLGVSEVFFDMNRFSLPWREQFRILERLRNALESP
jgi:probable F420-dependent oxidoreductase